MQIQDYVPTPVVPIPEVQDPAGWSDFVGEPFVLGAAVIAILLFAVLAMMVLRDRRDRPPTSLTP